MTVTSEKTMYCGICGGPIENNDPLGPADWLIQAVLLHPNDEHDDNIDILELPAKNKGGPYFELLETGAAITACDVDSAIIPTSKPLYIPSHTNCIFLAKKLMSFNGPGNAVPKSMRHLWQVLESRFHAASKDKYFPITNIYSAQAYGEIWRFQELAWEPCSDPNLNFEAQHFEADPVDIPKMSESILSHLQPLPSPDLPAPGPLRNTMTASGISQLPPEIMTLIMQQLRPLTSPSLECTYIVSANHWREALLHQSILPWLWDLDVEAIAQKEESKPTGQDWNWELLARQLAQIDIHEPRSIIEDLPLGLRNRRRIWRLVNDILAEDVGSKETSE